MLEDRLCAVAEAYCPDGYANNEGGYGSLTLYPAHGLAELEHYDRYEDTEEMDAAVAALPAGLRQGLSRRGVRTVMALFDGYGDSGQLDELTVAPDNVELNTALKDKLEAFLLGQLPGGWEINEGSFGSFTVEVATGRVVLDGSWRTEEESEARVTRWRWRN
jgi:hypothetical protein